MTDRLIRLEIYMTTFIGEIFCLSDFFWTDGTGIILDR